MSRIVYKRSHISVVGVKNVTELLFMFCLLTNESFLDSLLLLDFFFGREEISPQIY
jgi:hypothetical protein